MFGLTQKNCMHKLQPVLEIAIVEPCICTKLNKVLLIVGDYINSRVSYKSLFSESFSVLRRRLLHSWMFSNLNVLKLYIGKVILAT